MALPNATDESAGNAENQIVLAGRQNNSEARAALGQSVRAQEWFAASEGSAKTTQGPMREFLFLLDLVLIWMGALLARICLRHFEVREVIASTRDTIAFVLLLSVLASLFARLYKLHDWPRKTDEQQDVVLLAKSMAYSGAIAGICISLWNISLSVPAMVIPTAGISWLLLIAWRKFVRSQSITGVAETRNVLIVGCSPSAQVMRRHLAEHPELGYVFKGYLDRREFDRPTPSGNPEEAFILGSYRQLPVMARTHFIDEIFISIPGNARLLKEITQYGQRSGVHVRIIPEFLQGLAGEAPVTFVGEYPTLTLYEAPIPTIQLIVKRLFDVCVSAALLVLLSPVLLLIGVIVRLDSEGPILYGSLRVGKKGRTFVCYKFRSMVKNAEALKEQLKHLNERDGIFFKIGNDPRITWAGHFLRRFSLDELPQLWSVLKGDMSLVGPRPLPISEGKKYSLEHLERLDVTPGMTGLWQVEARRNPSFDHCIALDKQYVDDWSFWLDVRILWKTVAVVVSGTGQ